jgi:hypothetical protein
LSAFQAFNCVNGLAALPLATLVPDAGIFNTLAFLIFLKILLRWPEKTRSSAIHSNSCMTQRRIGPDGLSRLKPI